MEELTDLICKYIGTQEHLKIEMERGRRSMEEKELI